MRCQPYIELMDREAGDRVTELTGCPPTCDHGPKMLWWKHERPEEYRRIAKFVMPAAYVAGRMAGLKADQAFMDYTFIHFSGFSAMPNQALVAGAVPALRPGHGQAAGNRRALAGGRRGDRERCQGIWPGRRHPDRCRRGDTAANALGAGIVEPGMVFDVAGTAAVLAGCTEPVCRRYEKPRPADHALGHPGAVEPAGLYRRRRAGAALVPRPVLQQPRREEPNPPSMTCTAEMIDLAAAVSRLARMDCSSPRTWAARICPASPAMRGAWIGFSWGHTQAHFFRAILESVAYEYAYYLGILSELMPGLKLVEARVVGRGRAQRDLEPDQGRCAGRALPALAGQ